MKSDAIAVRQRQPDGREASAIRRQVRDSSDRSGHSGWQGDQIEAKAEQLCLHAHERPSSSSSTYFFFFFIF
jgi:hypothetical protein